MPKRINRIPGYQSTKLSSEFAINYNLEDKFSNAAAHFTRSHLSLTDLIGFAKKNIPTSNTLD